MPIKTEEIPCNFVGQFKVGDNLVYNTSIMCDFVESNRDSIFNKPIVLQVGSILEAALLQIIFRAQHYTKEGVPNIVKEDREEIKSKKIDKFYSVINVMQKYKILNDLGADIYEELHKLRCYRNKIHIQDDIKGASLDEPLVFSDDVCARALILNQRVLKHLSEVSPRPEYIHKFLRSLRVPC